MGETERGYRLSTERSPAAMIVFDATSYEIVDVNDPACVLYGYSREAFLRLRLEDLRTAGERTLLRQQVAGLDDGEVVAANQIRHSRSDGTGFLVSIRSQPIHVDGRALRVAYVRADQDGADPEATIERQALLFQGTNDAVLFSDAEGVIVDWNPAAERLWGYRKSEVLGQKSSLLQPGQTGDRVLNDILEGLRTDGRWEGEVASTTRDGEPRYCEVRVLPIYGHSGEMVGSVGINHDITARRNAERALAESTESLRILGDQIPHILWVADPSGQTHYLNERWIEFTGQTREEAEGEGWIAYLHPDDRERTAELWVHSLTTGEDFVHEHRLRATDGTYRWYLSSGTPVRDPEGRILRWLGSSLDIHAQKTAEETIRRREEYFRGVFENAHDAIVLFDAETGVVVDANPQASALYGWPREELLGHSADALFADRESVSAHMATLLDRGASTHLLPQRTRDGRTIQVEVNATVMEHRDRRVVLTINRDVTERLELEKQLQQAQKMEAVGRLAGGVAHDFNNLTTAIQGFTALLLDELDVEGEAREALTEIDRASDRARDLTRQLLAYTRQQVMRVRVLDLNEVVVSSRQLIARLIGEHIEVVTELEPELRPVKADPGQLNQVIMNLAVNARDAMPGGGSLSVETRRARMDRAFVDEHPGAREGEYSLLRVSDTGCGMDEKTRSHVFEPFFTTKAVGEGTGLGLSTVYGIVKQSGGYVWVDSEVGGGTTFDIYLPEVSAPVDPVEAVDTQAPRGGAEPTRPEGGETVLLVEDEGGVRKLARRVLERAGYRVLASADGSEALARAGRTPEIDLLLTDMVMPGMSGKELARRMALTHPRTRVLYMSGYTGESLTQRGDLTREDVVLEKPFRPAQLVEAVRQMLQTQMA